jgi:hypothetical protein
MRRLLAIIFALSIPAAIVAATYDTSNLPYSDAPSDTETAVAVSALTGEGILQGYPDGTFKPLRLVNRAEFLKMAMMAGDGEVLPVADTTCFPDVPPASWYAPFVCAAKRDGIVSGNVVAGVDSSQWLFDPLRPVQYEEALKMLVGVFGLPSLGRSNELWYERYIRIADERGVALKSTWAGHRLTRAETARLVVAFRADDRGELADLRSAQGMASASSRSSSGNSCEPYRCANGETHPSCTADGHTIYYFADPCLGSYASSSSRSSARSSSSRSSAAAIYDPDSDQSVRPNLLLLGTTASIVGAARVFSNTEPIDATDISVILNSAVTSIESFILYDHDTKYIGRAYRDDSVNDRTFTFRVPSGAITLPYREDYAFYVRPVLKAYTNGGVSGESVLLQTIRVQGNGEWSQATYTKDSTDPFSTSRTARSIITGISNVGPLTDALVAGANIPIATFRFAGTTGDGTANLAVTEIRFQAETSGGVTVSHLTLGADSTSDRTDCTVSSSIVTCSSIPAQLGSLRSSDRMLTLYGDVAVPSSAQEAHLRITINRPGTATSAGDLTWTDGSTSFQWVPFNTPVVAGTNYKL